MQYETDDMVAGDHTGRQQNHIWTKEEIDEALNTLYRHKPKTVSDYLMNYAVCPYHCCGHHHQFNGDLKPN